MAEFPEEFTDIGRDLVDGDLIVVNKKKSALSRVYDYLVTKLGNSNAIDNTMLRQGAAVSVVGRSANSTGNVADIAAGANDRILRRVSNALDFGQLTIGMVPDGLITLAKLATTISSGTWTPTISGESNVTGTSVVQTFYMQIGNVLLFGIRFTTTRTSATATKNILFSAPPPVASNFASSTQLFAVGTYVSTDGTATNIRGNSTSGTKDIVCNWQDSASSGGATFNLIGGGVIS